MSGPEIIPSVEQRQWLVNRIGRVAAGLKATDPELLAMMHLSVDIQAGVRVEGWRHLRNMAAIHYELVSSAPDEIIQAILRPQLTRLKSFREGWHHRSPKYSP